MRIDGRSDNQLRVLDCKTDVNLYAEGSCIFATGNTRVHCTASVSTDLPRWRRDSGKGWLTAEYRMLPRATTTRSQREGRSDMRGRTAEIQRLVARSLRAAVDLSALGRRQVMVDCDVLQADGGTRTASINGGFIAAVLAMRALVQAGQLPRLPLRCGLAAVSVGLVDGVPMLDLAYDEDARADVDLNVVMDSSARYIEVQGTAEGRNFARPQLDALLDLAEGGIREILEFQKQFLEGIALRG